MGYNSHIINKFLSKKFYEPAIAQICLVLYEKPPDYKTKSYNGKVFKSNRTTFKQICYHRRSQIVFSFGKIITNKKTAIDTNQKTELDKLNSDSC